jgi:hypothetical protein
MSMKSPGRLEPWESHGHVVVTGAVLEGDAVAPIRVGRVLLHRAIRAARDKDQRADNSLGGIVNHTTAAGLRRQLSPQCRRSNSQRHRKRNDASDPRPHVEPPLGGEPSM